LILFVCTKVPDLPESRVIRNQLTKSGTSIGANYREANRARSRADFINRIKICESEASETQYWLAVISDISWVSPEKIQTVCNECNECNELLAIFTTIGKKN